MKQATLLVIGIILGLFLAALLPRKRPEIGVTVRTDWIRFNYDGTWIELGEAMLEGTLYTKDVDVHYTNDRLSAASHE